MITPLRSCLTAKQSILSRAVTIDEIRELKRTATPTKTSLENLTLFQLWYFAMTSPSSIYIETTNCPGTKLIGVVFKLRKRNTNSRLCVDVLYKIFNLVNLRELPREKFRKDRNSQYFSQDPIYFNDTLVSANAWTFLVRDTVISLNFWSSSSYSFDMPYTLMHKIPKPLLPSLPKFDIVEVTAVQQWRAGDDYQKCMTFS